MPLLCPHAKGTWRIATKGCALRQWVFGEFSVMPVMTSMGMLFTLFHNVNCYVGAHNLADTGELFWWEGAF